MLDVGKLRAELEQRRDDPGLVAFMIRSSPDIAAAGLMEMAWLLSSPRFGTASYNDVKGLIDDLEKWQCAQGSLGQ